ncbi:MAG: hypothetical protein LJE68_02400 [Rhodobacter sp.]|nr:hypothetical protein [Rhodobacter sp.]
MVADPADQRFCLRVFAFWAAGAKSNPTASRAVALVKKSPTLKCDPTAIIAKQPPIDLGGFGAFGAFGDCGEFGAADSQT